MAELRINTTGKLSLFDADDSHAASIIAGTVTANENVMSLATAGVTFSADAIIGDDLTLSSDSAVVSFGADADTTLTHTDGTGLTLNSTNKLCFNDASQFVQGSSATVLSIGATDEIDLTATAVDLNGTLDVSGAMTAAAITASGLVIAGAKIDLNGTELLLDADADTSITADTDDQIDIRIAGADDFQMTANTFTVASGSKIAFADGGDVSRFMVDRWRVTSSLTTSDTEPVSANLERSDDHGSDADVATNALVNPGMTESSGVFTFPATGKYHVEFVSTCNSTSDERYVGLFIQETINGGSNYYTMSTVYSSIEDANASGTWAGLYTDAYIDVTNTTNVLVRFNVNAEINTIFYGDTARDYTYMTFTRIGDT